MKQPVGVALVFFRARTDLKDSDGELAELGGELDVMVERLESRDRALRRTLAELDQKALTDELTGLYDRRFFDDALTRRFVEARRDPAPFSVSMLDLDHFKKVNDSYGHDTGDHVLREIGHVIGGSIRASDIAARYGGEEFTVLMPDTILAVAQERAELLRRQIQRVDIHSGPHRVRVTASLGVVQSASHFEEPAGLMKAVDLAVYEAKSRGRNCVVLGSHGEWANPQRSIRSRTHSRPETKSPLMLLLDAQRRRTAGKKRASQSELQENSFGALCRRRISLILWPNAMT